MHKKIIFLFVGIFATLNLVISTKARDIVDAYAPDQTTDIPHWQFIHVDAVDPENSEWFHNTAIHRMSVISDTLFLSTENETDGGEVWRTTNGVSWEQVNQNGFGTTANRSILVGDPLNDYLYAGTYNPTTGGQIWRCQICDGSDWEKVVDGGFGDSNNTIIQRIVLHGGGALCDNR